ncbi:hypothetical protein LJC17_04310 [Acholeplasma sp. OttesenSCG-928-E16]|nr:hypothetical protein [Acholeplasma sp. OttesenSCG-928-E16]
MRITNEVKLQMCEDRLIRGLSLSHIQEKYGGYDIGRLKYFLNLYKKHGPDVFIDRQAGKYGRETKLLAIGRVKKGESIRQVALDWGLIGPSILGDWIKVYDTKGDAAIQDTYPGKSYMLLSQ